MLFTTILAVSILSVPSRPEEIVYPEYVFTPPVVSDYQEVLLGGIPVFIAQDNSLPLINVVATFRGGDYLLPEENTGLVSVMASLIRDGGTMNMSAEEVDEQFAYLASVCGVSGDGNSVTASLNSLSSTFDESFALFLDILQKPAFQESRLELEKDAVLEAMKQRNDDPSGILQRENARLLFGHSYMGRGSTPDTLATITGDSLHETYSAIINPSNLVIAISGDFDKKTMLEFLNTKLGVWKAGAKSSTPPSVDSNYTPGVYYVQQDVPQGGVRICVRSLRRGDPDVEAAEVMNYILGGGGFSSRITQTVRSDEGLAYSAGSRFSPGVWGDGLWAAGYESKSETVALAAKLIFDEIEEIKNELVSDEDLALAKSAIIEKFPSEFQSKADTLGVFVSDYLSERSNQYWDTYRDKIYAVTKEDVKRVANKILRVEDMFVLVVGNWDVISAGDSDERANMEMIRAIVGGPVTEIPLRDPLTLESIQ